MIVECERCYARYRYDEARFEGRASKKLRCTRCQAVFEVYNTQAYERQPALHAVVAPEETLARRPEEPPRDATTRRSRLPVERSPADLKLPENLKLSLAVIAGPEAGRIFTIEKARVVIGRQEADVSLEDPEVSRRHAAIEVAGDRVMLVDLGSTNGTFIGDEQVGEAPLDNQAEFTLGSTTLMLIVTAPG